MIKRIIQDGFIAGPRVEKRKNRARVCFLSPYHVQTCVAEAGEEDRVTEANVVN